MPVLSIIVPVYKVEPYLPKCIESILAQTFTDFELILIDDGSPDRCGEICDEYAAKDNRIVVIHQKNEGVSAARNAGLDAAKGDYIGFVDSDDLIHPSMYQMLYETAETTGSEITCCNSELFETNTPPDFRIASEGLVSGATVVFPKNEIQVDLYSRPSVLKGFCYTKLFCSSLLSNVRFPLRVPIWEDLCFLSAVYNSEDGICAAYLNDTLYYYRIRNQSATRSLTGCNFRGRSKMFKKQIYSMLPCESSDVRAAALGFFLDSCVSHLQLCDQFGRAKTRRDIFRVKRAMLYWILHGTIYNLLTPAQRHRFLKEGVLH